MKKTMAQITDIETGKMVSAGHTYFSANTTYKRDMEVIRKEVTLEMSLFSHQRFVTN